MKVFLCGDVMTGRGIDQIFPSSVNPLIHESYVKDARDYIKLAEAVHGPVPRNVSPHYIWGDCHEVWKRKKPDLKIINLETTITTSGSYALKKGIHYRMHPDNVRALKAADIDVCSLANNHVLDWGSKGLSDTVIHLEENQILHTGAGKGPREAGAPAVCEWQGRRILVFGICFPSSGVPESWKASEGNPGVNLLQGLGRNSLNQFKQTVDDYKWDGDVVIASIHWGSNWGYEIPPAQVQFAHELIDEVGVQVIHGHSSHHPRPFEIYKGHPVFYGCGDFFNDYEGIRGYEEYRSDLALMYFITFSLPFKLERIEMVCLQIKNFQLSIAQGRDLKWMYETLKKESESFKTSLILKEDEIISIPGRDS
ncbi:MAG: CapA family protein [Bacteriovoracia bacterium]